MASDKLEHLSQQLEAGKSVSNPPLHLWQPELSGTIDIVIRRDGSWIHEGTQIKRFALVRIFASILRREEDGEYYLVTPVEKWRLRVECLPLVIVDFELLAAGTTAHLRDPQSGGVKQKQQHSVPSVALPLDQPPNIGFGENPLG